MGYEEIMMQYNMNYEVQQENKCAKAAIYTAQILEMIAVDRLERSLKAPPGSNAPEEYKEACQTLAEWTGQTAEETDRRIREIRERINAVPTDRRPRDKTGSLNELCRTCRKEIEGRCKEACYFIGLIKDVSARKEAKPW